MADKITLIGVDKFKKQINKFTANSKRNLKNALKETLINIVIETKENTPVGEVNGGTLKASYEFGIDSGGLSGEVFTVTEYAAYVEFGTKNADNSIRMAAQPHFIPAVESNRGNFIAEVTRAIKNAESSVRIGL